MRTNGETRERRRGHLAGAQCRYMSVIRAEKGTLFYQMRPALLLLLLMASPLLAELKKDQIEPNNIFQEREREKLSEIMEKKTEVDVLCLLESPLRDSHQKLFALHVPRAGVHGSALRLTVRFCGPCGQSCRKVSDSSGCTCNVNAAGLSSRARECGVVRGCAQ